MLTSSRNASNAAKATMKADFSSPANLVTMVTTAPASIRPSRSSLKTNGTARAVWLATASSASKRVGCTH
jgi:hypothetical protein